MPRASVSLQLIKHEASAAQAKSRWLDFALGLIRDVSTCGIELVHVLVPASFACIFCAILSHRRRQ